MSRFLFVVPPLAAHVHPTAAVGAELVARGHDVAWVGHLEHISPMLPPGARAIEVGYPDSGSPEPVGSRQWGESMQSRRRGMRGPAAFRFLWEEFLIPLATSMVPGVEAAVDDFCPDVVAVDQHTLAGALVAHARRLPWATLAIMSAELVDAPGPKLQAWVTERVNGFMRRFDGLGVDTSEAGDLRFSEHLVLAFTTAALVGPLERFPGHYRFVGPSIYPRGGDFPWDRLDPARQHVFLTLGTVAGDVGQRFLSTAIEAVESVTDRIQLIVVAPPGAIDSSKADVLVRDFVPYLELLPHLDVVVCHAGHTTTCEALAFGVPLVVAPIRDDNPVVAGQVEAAGAGIRVKFGRVRAAELCEAILTVLDDPSYRRAALRVQASFAAAGGSVAAADCLEKLV
ncbi:MULTISPECIES: nucleotide disphospho-sugar-binding domain-containing protein [unclassified Nocardia]|uniref:glycosyltransferase n=1 Tax=unclassified Nocardia TaxID=2637762 RepID=UPI0034238C66